MRRTATIATGLSVVLLTAALVVPGPVAGDEEDSWKPDGFVGGVVEEGLGDKKKEHKGEEKVKYVNLGVLGDVLGIYCPGVDEVEEVDAGVLVVDFYDPGDEAPDGDVNVPLKPGLNGEGDPEYCLGGAVGGYPEGTDATVWDVWIHDYVWDNLEGLVEFALDQSNLLLDQGKDPNDPADRFMVDFKTAGLARMVVEYEYDEAVKGDPGTTSTCVSDEDGDGAPDVVEDADSSNTAVCVQQGVGTHTATRNINQFGVCGQSVIDTASGMLEPFDVMADPTAPGDPLERVNKEATKVVFVDGLAFFQFDCALQDEVGGLFNQVTGFLNEGVDPIPGLCEEMDLICFFEYPSNTSQCFADKQDPNPMHMNLPVVGIVGTVGWSHDPAQADGKCRETALHGEWMEFGPPVVDAGIKNAKCTVTITWNAVSVAIDNEAGDDEYFFESKATVNGIAGPLVRHPPVGTVIVPAGTPPPAVPIPVGAVVFGPAVVGIKGNPVNINIEGIATEVDLAFDDIAIGIGGVNEPKCKTRAFGLNFGVVGDSVGTVFHFTVVIDP